MSAADSSSTTSTLRQRPSSVSASKNNTHNEQVPSIKETVAGEVRRVKLSLWTELPEWQQDNCYILSGYVRETLSYLECLRSLTYLHNETVNIYSHMVPGALFFAACFFFFRRYMERYDTTTWADELMFSLFALGAAAALTLSSSFHCLKCHSEHVATFGNKLDYLGIVVLIVTSMVSIIYYALADQPLLRNCFWALTFAFGVVCAALSLGARFRTNAWRPYRALMFVLFGLSGIFPIVVGYFLYGFREVCRRSQLLWIVAEGVLYCLGAFLYAARVPERFSPGTFDLIGHSHQIFHVLVVIAAGCHGRGLIGAYIYSHENIIPRIGEN